MERVVQTQRFEVVRRLGAGATGVVYEAHNRKSGERVALKALSQFDASSLYRFKREFRALSGVSHPNLVTLHELFHEGGQWYLSMELVHGRSFVDHVRGARGEPDLGRLRPALAQLVRAIHAVHQAGRLHRDVKPSNVLVTEQGRVVVLDFGFVREIDASESTELVGTPAYMAPEQAEFGGAEPASDWYSVGVVLFEALTGRVPFAGSSTSTLLEKLERAAPRVSAFWAGAPADLELLCSELLARDPKARPLGAALLERVGGAIAEWRPVPASVPSSDLFVGRAAMLARLHAAFERARREAAPQVVMLTGASAMGKSALLERFAGELSGRGAWVLLGRCHERENVPYKALDGIVDALVRRLGELSELELARVLPRYLGSLTLHFPVLLRIPTIAQQATRYLRPADPHELRRHAAAALQELLGRISDCYPLVLLIDDLQWGDVDSMNMLRDVLSVEDMSGLLLLAAYRDEPHGSASSGGASGASASFDSACVATEPASAGSEGERAASLIAFGEAVAGLARRGQVERAALGPLAQEEALELAQKLLGAQGQDPALLRHVVREAERVPLFIQELARHVVAGGSPATTLEQLVLTRLGRLTRAARGLLELVALAAAPLPIAVARALIESDAQDTPVEQPPPPPSPDEPVSPRAGSELEELVRELLRERLVRKAFHPSESLDTRHDEIRAIVKRSLAPVRAAQHHFALARELAAHGAGPEQLVHHFRSGGDPSQAAGYAARAAELAERSLAFMSAARCYELALSWGSFAQAEESALRVRLAEALASAGRGREAGEAYLGAAELARREQRPGLRARAVDQLLRAGQLEAGVELGDTLLHELGLGGARTGPRALVELLLRRAWLWVRGYGFQAHEPSEIEPRSLIRVEAARAMSHALGHMDPFAAANMQARHLLLSLESGDTFSVARALGYQAVYLAIEGAAHSQRALALLARQRELCAESSHPYLRAFDHYARGVVEWGRASWSLAIDQLDRAEAAYRSECVGVAWEMLAAQLLALGCLSFLGHSDELRRRVVRISEEARARDDRLTLEWILGWQAIVDLLRDDLAAAHQSISEARARLPARHYTLPHLFVLYAATYASLYAGDGLAAHARLAREWPKISRSQLLRLQVYRVETLRLRAAAALCAAQRGDRSSRRALQAGVERDLWRLEREQLPWSTALASALRGELRFQQGLRDAALANWELAEAQLRALEMNGHAAATRRCIGLALGGEEGRGMVAAADGWFRSQGVAQPERVAALHVGGSLPSSSANT